ncbi:hypothetical protein [Streptomyces sp. NBC_01233]|uniref:hypothetical protein n=1 Tax=Streptomyces sp. NBC_01233 TaxID=2903787 RepID=UPI002E0EBF7F|nr:hypothetical protein OG332_07285 [Streptomyces sp. NBC_01233]
MDREPGIVGETLVEEVDGVLVLRSYEEEFPTLDDLVEVASAASGDDGCVTLVVGSAELAGGQDREGWGPLGELIDTLHRKGTSKIQLVLSHAGNTRSEDPCLAHRIAEAWAMEVVAPDGTVLITPGGTLFVQGNAQRAGNWWSFADGVAPRPLGPRTPAPSWQQALGRAPLRTAGGCSVVQIPAGVLLSQAGAAGPGEGDLAYAVPSDAERPLMLVGTPLGDEVAPGDVAEVLAALPVAERAAVRLAPGSGRDLLGLSQTVADMLGGEVEVLAGIPLMEGAPGAASARTTVVGSDGEPSWQPYLTAVTCLPTAPDGVPASPRAAHWQSMASIGETEEAEAAGWRVDATRAGLALLQRDAPVAPITGLPVDPDSFALELGQRGRALDDAALPRLSRLLLSLPPANRVRTTVFVYGTPANGGKDLRRLAAQHGIARVRYLMREESPVTPPAGPMPVLAPPTETTGVPEAEPSRRPTPVSVEVSVPVAVATSGTPSVTPPVPGAEPGTLRSRAPEALASTGAAAPAGAAPEPELQPVPVDIPAEGSAPACTPVPAAEAVPVALPTHEPGRATAPGPAPVPDGPSASERSAVTVAESVAARGTTPRAEARRPPEAPTSPGARPDALLPFAPGHVSTPAERAAFRALAADVWEAHGAQAARMLTRSPALRGPELDEARTDLVALLAYLSDQEGNLSAGELLRDLATGGGRLSSYAACLTSGLRRLPSYRGATLRGGSSQGAGDTPGTGSILRAPGPVSTWLKCPEIAGGAPVRYAFWSVTGRKVRRLVGDQDTGPEEVVFAPGSAFRVLGTRVVSGSSVMMLRELPGSGASSTADAGALGPLDRTALAHLEQALGADHTTDAPGWNWPERGAGSIWHAP